jgi:hypothetical protein
MLFWRVIGRIHRAKWLSNHAHCPPTIVGPSAHSVRVHRRRRLERMLLAVVLEATPTEQRVERVQRVLPAQRRRVRAVVTAVFTIGTTDAAGRVNVGQHGFGLGRNLGIDASCSPNQFIVETGSRTAVTHFGLSYFKHVAYFLSFSIQTGKMQNY